MGKVRGELGDLAFRHLDPEAFEETAQTIESKCHANEEFLNEIRTTVESELRREGVPARVEGRLKRPHSVHEKIRRQKIANRTGLRPDSPGRPSPTR
jgi:(p)ppGpp synthase/HD superfamily hydrolase